MNLPDCVARQTQDVIGTYAATDLFQFRKEPLWHPWKAPEVPLPFRPYLRAHKPFLTDEKFHYRNHLTLSGLARPFHAIDEMDHRRL